METVSSRKVEVSRFYGSISWRAIFAGAFVALLAYFALLSLGVAVGSGSLESAAQGTGSASGIGLGAGIWMAVSIFLSLFAGSFAAGRIGGTLPIRIGRAQGLVITALFFVFVFSQVGSAVGLLGKGVGSTVSAIGNATTDISQNPQVQDLTDQALGNLHLKSPPEVVAKGVVMRVVQGDADGAKNYLAGQAGITPAQANDLIERLKPQVEQVLRNLGAGAAKAASAVGWAIFFSIVLGSIGGSLGGSFGAALNLRKPVSSADERAASGPRAA